MKSVLVVEADAAAPAAAGGARLEHEGVAEQPAEWVLWVAGESGGYEAVRGAFEQRYLCAGDGGQRIGITIAPLADAADEGAQLTVGEPVQRPQLTAGPLGERPRPALAPAV